MRKEIFFFDLCRFLNMSIKLDSLWTHLEAMWLSLSLKYKRSLINVRSLRTGVRCDQCDINYFGNPLVPGGTCDACFCNNNIDPNMPGSCDASTGECLRCLYNSEGYNCEFCKPGFFGDATRQNCQGMFFIVKIWLPMNDET